MEIEKSKNIVCRYNPELFKQRLKEVSGKNQTQIAQDCSLSKGTLNKRINAKDGHLTVFDLMDFAQKYDCSIDYLVGLSDVRKKNTPEEKAPLKYSSYARFISDCFHEGLYTLDDTCIDKLALSNEIAKYIFDNILSMRALLVNDTITQDVYNTWLDGLCNDFDYLVISPASIVLEKKDGSGQTTFPDFENWKFIKQPIPTLSERELLKAYACELDLYHDIPFRLDYEDLSYAIIKPTTDKQVAI